MPYGETYSNSERSLAEAIADAILARDPSTLKIQEICNKFDFLLDLLEGVISPSGGLKIDLPVTKYVSQQHELSTTWIVRSPVQYPQSSIYVTQIGGTTLPGFQEVEAKKQLLDNYTLQIIFAEPCLGFVVLN